MKESDIEAWGEIKPRSFASLRSRLQALGAEFVKETSESDEVEDTQDET
jgi:hypothetical protein